MLARAKGEGSKPFRNFRKMSILGLKLCCHVGLHFSFKTEGCVVVVVAHAYDPNTWEAEADRFLNSRQLPLQS